MCKLRRVLYQPRRTRRRHIVVRHVPEAISRIWGGAAAAGSCCCCWRFWRRPKTFILFTGCNTSGGDVTIFSATLRRGAGLHVGRTFPASLPCFRYYCLCLFVVVPCLLSIALRYKVCAVVTTPFRWIYVVQADGGMSYSCVARL